MWSFGSGAILFQSCIFKTLETKPHIQIVVDPLETRDFDAATTTFVKCDPLAFVTSFGGASETNGKASTPNIDRWAEANEAEAALITSVEDASFVYTCTREGCFNQEIALEGAYVQALIEQAAPRSLIFSANSMAIRALDTFYVKPSTPDAEVIELGAPRASRACDVTLLANRGLNGIDGTLSSALGAAQAYDQTYFLTGDLTLLHDLQRVLALQHEFELRATSGKPMPSIIVILFNNGGGGIFDMLPQKSSDPYFERLFLTPQQVDFEACGKLFGVLYKNVSGLDEFRATLDSWSGTGGIHLLEVDFSLEGLAGRFRQFQ